MGMIKTEHAVAMTVAGARPQPALARASNVNLAPKALVG